MRLIDAEKLLEEFGEEPEILLCTEDEIQAHADWITYRAIVNAQDTVYAVPVVRCKDCKIWVMGNNLYNLNHCMRFNSFTHPDDFCSYGERKEGDDNGLTETVPVLRGNRI